MTQYQIKFTAGENQGTVYPLSPGQAVSIGRSHSNTIRVSAPDVSGKHIIIRLRGALITVEVLSSRITKLDGNDVSMGDMLDVSPGSVIQMGETTVFVIEHAGASDDGDDDMATCIPDDADKTVIPQEATAPATAAPEQKTTPPRQAPKPVPPEEIYERTIIGDDNATVAAGEMTMSGGGGATETIAFQTRVASDDEMENIKNAFRVKRRKKIIMLALPLFLFFVISVFLYFYLRPSTEEFVTWPTNSSGEYLNDFRQIAPYLALAFPGVPGVAVTGDEYNAEIHTKIGKRLDVPMHILATGVKDPATLEQDHPQAFDNWMEMMREKEPTMSFGGDRTTVFLNTSRGAGVPLSIISYTRRVENDDFWGYALFVRNVDYVHSVMIEVPLADQWRATPFMHQQVTGMIIYAPKVTEEHWEGASSYRRDTTVATDLREASSFMQREAPVYWGRIYYLLRSALIKSAKAEKPDQEQITEAKSLLVKLRRQQTTWFNTQRLAWQYAFQNEDKDTMNSIQAMGESVFSSEFQYSDYRYDLVKRKDWK